MVETSDPTSFAPGLDPALFKPDAVAPETRAFYESLAAEEHRRGVVKVPPDGKYDVAMEREQRATIEYVSPLASERTVPSPAGDVQIRILRPNIVRAVYVYIHGGCWVSGGCEQQDTQLERIARVASAAVVSIGYRLAPEHPYPAAPDDCEAATRWVIEHAANEFGTERTMIGGASAGAHLAAVTILRMRDRHGYSSFAGADLVAGIYDVSMTPSMARYGPPPPGSIFSTPRMEFCTARFVPEQAMRRHPDVSPLYADLDGMPPALFTIGTNDPLLDDSLFMYARWLAAGNEAEIAVYPGGTHGFTRYPIPIAAPAEQRREEFITRCLA